MHLIILHGTYMPTDEAALAHLCNPASQVSCHYYISRDGQLTQLVKESDVAWHAGKSTWQGLEGATGTLNGTSLGIELGNAGPFRTPPTPEEEANPNWANTEPYTPAQMATLTHLLAYLLKAHALTPACVLGHADVAPGRKSDPGPHFPWPQLVAQGLAVRP